MIPYYYYFCMCSSTLTTQLCNCAGRMDSTACYVSYTGTTYTVSLPQPVVDKAARWFDVFRSFEDQAKLRMQQIVKTVVRRVLHQALGERRRLKRKRMVQLMRATAN